MSRSILAFAATALVATLPLGACSLFVAPQSPAQALYEVKGDFNAAIVVADAYAGLPNCGPGAPALCRTKDVLDSVRKTADQGKKLLDQASVDLAAYQASAAGVTLATVNADIAAFQATVTTLQGAVATLKVK